ncbi:hypothetical protein A2U01_0081113 [Trifolium medium]|uniref:Uncharacterized protein n=1 Tax=Trifolium medium TaxID=97028 RepID=A0A392TFS4_9FABA|nr:hypothetical protein [Trifolium medium]
MLTKMEEFLAFGIPLRMMGFGCGQCYVFFLVTLLWWWWDAGGVGSDAVSVWSMPCVIGFLYT